MGSLAGNVARATRRRAVASVQTESSRSFPTFEMMEPASSSSTMVTAAALGPREAEPNVGGDMVRGIQRLVTTARKAEIKARKTEEEREAMESRWKCYQEELQAAFVKERNRYVQAMGG